MQLCTVFCLSCGEDRVLGEDVVYVKCVLRGEPTRIIRELKGRGVACSVREIVVQGLLALEEKTIEREIQVERSKSLRRVEEP